MEKILLCEQKGAESIVKYYLPSTLQTITATSFSADTCLTHSSEDVLTYPFFSQESILLFNYLYIQKS